jgi:hypothetical protein
VFFHLINIGEWQGIACMGRQYKPSALRVSDIFSAGKGVRHRLLRDVAQEAVPAIWLEYDGSSLISVSM